MSVLLVLVGVALLYGGGELLVGGAVRLSNQLGVSSLVIGLTVVAFGTSSPELAATLVSALSGAPELAVGNVLGSNIANLGLILGLSALLAPLQSRSGFVWRELPTTVAIALLLTLLLWDGVLGRGLAALLLGLLVVYLLLLLRDPASRPPPTAAADEEPLWRPLLLALGGALLLLLGARALVTGAVDIARGLGVAERVIGLTLVAFGTSLPELASSLVAAARRQTDLLLGNVVGSNVFNTLAVMGTTAMVSPLRVDPAGVRLDLWVALGFSLLLLLLMARRGRLGHVAGGVLLLAYLTYVGLLLT